MLTQPELNKNVIWLLIVHFIKLEIRPVLQTDTIFNSQFTSYLL